MRPGKIGLLSGAVATCACRPAMGMAPDRVTADDFRFDATVADVASSRGCKIAADLDGDGTMDVVLSSSEGEADVVWWRRPKGAGERESHLGTQAHDLDGDGYDQQHVWLWRNDAIEIKGVSGRAAPDGSAHPERSWFVRLTYLLTRIVN